MDIKDSRTPWLPQRNARAGLRRDTTCFCRRFSVSAMLTSVFQVFFTSLAIVCTTAAGEAGVVLQDEKL